MKKPKYLADSDRFTAELGESSQSPNSLVASRRRIGLNINLVMLAWPRYSFGTNKNSTGKSKGKSRCCTVLAPQIQSQVAPGPCNGGQYPVRFPYCN